MPSLFGYFSNRKERTDPIFASEVLNMAGAPISCLFYIVQSSSVGVQKASTVFKTRGASHQLFRCISAQSTAIRSEGVQNLLERKDCCCGTTLALSPGEQKAAPHNCWSTQSPLFSQVSQLQRLLPLPESKSSPPSKAKQQLHDRQDIFSVSVGGGVLTSHALRG